MYCIFIIFQKEESDNISQCSAGGRGRHSKYKLYIGWQHYSGGRYRVVTVKKGGGTRMMEYFADENLTVPDIVRIGSNFFFPKKKNQLGDLMDMEVSLASFSGENLETFMDLDGKECSFQEYLKSHGLFSSQYHLYIRTKLKESDKVMRTATCSEDCDKTESIFLVNNENPGDIKLNFKKTKNSKYSGSPSTISSSTMKKCYSLSMHQEIPYDDYNCITHDSYLLAGVEKNGKIYLTQLEDESYELCNYTSHSTTTELIMYGPDEINGLCDGDLMLGIITQVHNQHFNHQWFKDGVLFFEGPDVSIIKVKSPGEYSAGIQVNGSLFMCGASCCIVEKPEISEDTLPLSQSNIPVRSMEQLAASETFSFGLSEQNQTLSICSATCNLSGDDASTFHRYRITRSLQTEVDQCNNVLTFPIAEQSDVNQKNAGSCSLPTIDVSFGKGNCQGALQGTVKKAETQIEAEQCNDASTFQTTECLQTETNQLHVDVSQKTNIDSCSLPKIAMKDISFGEEIGRGAFGTVRKAEWLGTEVAVKEIVVKRMKLAKPLIKHELAIHSTVRHPNIIQIMAYGLENNKLFMVSELNNGKNLDDVIFGEEYENTLSYDTKHYIARNVLQAVAYLHNQVPAIIHRDIKPENILVSDDLKRIRLCDLGISKFKTMNTIMVTTSDGTTQPGTPTYQAPEVLLERRSGHVYSDMWSVGCTVLELFLEVPAWSVPVDTDPVAYIVGCMKEKKKPDSLQDFATKFSQISWMVELVNSCCCYDVNSRPNALEMLKGFKQNL